MLKLKLFCLLLALLLLPRSVYCAEIYSIQIGVYARIENAENEYQTLRNTIDPAHLEALRIEKKGPHFAVRIGRFNQEKPARELLFWIKKTFPSLFSGRARMTQRRSSGSTDYRLRGRKKESPTAPGPSLSPVFPDSIRTGRPTPTPAPTPKGRNTYPPDINSPSEKTLEMGRAMLWGTILESSPLPGNPLGLTPEKEIFRVMVRVDKSEPLKGYPNFLRDKETEEITVFSEVRPPFFCSRAKNQGRGGIPGG